MSIESNRNGYLSCRAEAPGEKIFLSNDTSRRDLTFLKSNSLRSKRFQSSYCAKVGARPKKKWKRGGGEVIRTLTTFSANSAGRLAPQARIPITSCAGSDRSLSLPCYQNLSPLFSSINLRLTFENEDDYSQTTFTSYL